MVKKNGDTLQTPSLEGQRKLAKMVSIIFDFLVVDVCNNQGWILFNQILKSEQEEYLRINSKYSEKQLTSCKSGGII